MQKNSQSVEYIDRPTGQRITESVMGDGALRFAYETLRGRTLWPVLFGSRLVSSLMGLYYDSRFSRKAIRSLATIPGCRADEAEKPLEGYTCFNDFFTRHLKPGARPLGEGVVSPADGRLRLYLNADLDAPFPLKGATKTLRAVLADAANELPPNGRFDIAVFRLAPVDYHRFHFPCDCTIIGSTRVIPGEYHSVNPIALAKRPDVYADNERQVVTCEGAFGRFWLVDVGAFGVGTIIQTFKGEKQSKGAEKGYFKFGGSTVILITKTGALQFDTDLVQNSARGLETRVLCREKIALAPRCLS